MNFNLVVSIFVLAIAEINLVRATDWEVSYSKIRIFFGSFIRNYEKAYMDPNSEQYRNKDYYLTDQWYQKTNLENFIASTEETINLLTSNFKPLKTEDRVSAVRTAMKTLCEKMNTNKFVNDKYKYGGIPLRDYFRNDLYIKGLEETGENFDTDCPLQ